MFSTLKSLQMQHRCIEELHAMPYEEYLTTDWWKFIRNDAIERAAGKCQVCNAGGKLEVHHRTYERRGCEHLTDLVVLCGGEDGCHALFHKHGRLQRAEVAA